MGGIIEKLEELEQYPEALDVGEDGFDDDPYDPTEFIDEDDELTSAAGAVIKGSLWVGLYLGLPLLPFCCDAPLQLLVWGVVPKPPGPEALAAAAELHDRLAAWQSRNTACR